MLIIVEGCDGAGKTHLIKRIKRRLAPSNTYSDSDALTVLHCGPPTGDPLDEYVAPLLDYVYYREPQRIICDRWHWGEMIYPTVFNRSSKMDAARWRYIELFLMSRGAVVVWVDTDMNTIVDTINKRGDAMITTKDAGYIIDRYHEVSQMSLLPSMRVHRSVNVEEIVEFALDATARHAYMSTFSTFVGSSRPHTLFVGDVRNRRNAHDRGTAFMPYGGTSGHYLLSNLPDWFFVQPDRIALVNACDVDDIEDVMRNVVPRYVVALGHNAHRKLSRSNVPFFGSAPHPQFIRRFYHKSGEAYGGMLSDVGIFGRDERKWRP